MMRSLTLALALAALAPLAAQEPRALRPLDLAALAHDTPGLDVRPDKVWTPPGVANALLVEAPKIDGAGEATLEVRVETPFGALIHEVSQKAVSGTNRVAMPPLKEEGGFLAKVELRRAGKVSARGHAALSVVRNIADDLRYGFFASFEKVRGDYDAKADMLARLHVNAVEYYDYFPAHGYYAPREVEYRFEPFGKLSNALDIQRKINAGHRRGILSLAYVAAYAASKSIYDKCPDPMTDDRGVPKIFNGQLMPEDQADREGKPKWFWIMNVDRGSQWNRYIMAEFRRTLDNAPGDLVSFDGFEIDTYGDADDSKFYAKDSRRNGQPLRDVLRDFVSDVRTLTRSVKPYGLVSFNSVNEFGVKQMVGVTDFLFLEIWRSHADSLERLVEICYSHRAPRRQRVVLKLYPADMDPKRSTWPASTLRRVLGATMTGAGSLMVAGEPDEEKEEMHALNSLYYPDHQPLSRENEGILRDYYRYDALLYGYTHGSGVVNSGIEVSSPGCITRSYGVPGRRAFVVQFLNIGYDKLWASKNPLPDSLRNKEISFHLPAGVKLREAWFGSPDTPELQVPAKIDFDQSGTLVRTLLPKLRVHGTLIFFY